jgi:BirA family biotin operon repressor/biotin-[acetyl-CoA-carboxylase] ligase
MNAFEQENAEITETETDRRLQPAAPPSPLPQRPPVKKSANRNPQSAIPNSTACGASHCCSVSQSAILHEGWLLHEIPVANSTNLLAADLPVWEAVRADRQTAGRGRFQRGWVSDEGGLWLSAVIPTPPKPAEARALPLAVGLAVCDALRSIGLTQFRLRWPNDVMVHDRKLAGLLIDQFVPGRAVAGIGINVSNQPTAHDPSLKHQTARLADLLPAPPDLGDLAQVVLGSLRMVVLQLHAHGFVSLLPRLNQLWGHPRRVELDLDGDLRRGTFAGVGPEGELLLLDDSAHEAPCQACQVPQSAIRNPQSAIPQTAYHACQVRHLRELD